MNKPPRKVKKMIKAAAKAEVLKPAAGQPPAKPMKTIAISKFKARCLAELEQVRRTREPLLVTRFGKPVAQIQPPPVENNASWIGSMRGTFKIVGDIVSPLGTDDWEVFR